VESAFAAFPGGKIKENKKAFRDAEGLLIWARV